MIMSLNVIIYIHFQVMLPGDMFTRSFHVATSTSLIPGIEEVTLFGGSSTFASGVSIEMIPKMANTTLLIVGKIMPISMNPMSCIIITMIAEQSFGVDTNGCGEL